VESVGVRRVIAQILLFRPAWGPLDSPRSIAAVMQSIFWPPGVCPGQGGHVAPLPGLAMLMSDGSGRAFDGCLPPLLGPPAGGRDGADRSGCELDQAAPGQEGTEAGDLERTSKWSATAGSCQGPTPSRGGTQD
jgi:hypothetical protein